ncbi:HrcA family transcriptional regulator, partial [Thermus scotoductus]
LSQVQAGFARGEWLGELVILGPMRMRYLEALSVASSLSRVYTGGHAG